MLLDNRFKEPNEWTAVVGFVRAKLHYNLLGQAGCLQFFNADSAAWSVR
jgi:hypothetical protein